MQVGKIDNKWAVLFWNCNYGHCKKKKKGVKKTLKEQEIFTLILYLQDTKKKKIKKIEIYFGGIHQIDWKTGGFARSLVESPSIVGPLLSSRGARRRGSSGHRWAGVSGSSSCQSNVRLQLLRPKRKRDEGDGSLQNLRQTEKEAGVNNEKNKQNIWTLRRKWFICCIFVVYERLEKAACCISGRVSEALQCLWRRSL